MTVNGIIWRAAVVGLACVLPFAAYLWYGFTSDPVEPDEAVQITVIFAPLAMVPAAAIGLAAAHRLGLPRPWVAGLVAPAVLTVLAAEVGYLAFLLGVDTAGGWEGAVGWALVAVVAFPALVLLLSAEPVGRRPRLVAAGTAVALAAGMTAFAAVSQHRWRLDYYQNHLGDNPALVVDLPNFRAVATDYGTYPAGNGLRWQLAGRGGTPFAGTRTVVYVLYVGANPDCDGTLDETGQNRRLCTEGEHVSLFVDGKRLEVDASGNRGRAAEIEQHVFRSAELRQITLDELADVPRRPRWTVVGSGTGVGSGIG